MGMHLHGTHSILSLTYPTSLPSGVSNGSSIRDLDKYSRNATEKQGFGPKNSGWFMQEDQMQFYARDLDKYSSSSLGKCKATATGDTIPINTGI